jgi:hypothetical protein
MMNGWARFFFSIFFFLTLVTGVKAQFWKKKEDQASEKPSPRFREKQDVSQRTRRIKIIEYPVSKIKSRYRIDILLPLYLDELVTEGLPSFKDRLPEKAQVGMGFFEGVQLAADSLSALGYHLDVYVHDISEKGLSLQEFIRKENLTASDLVIGAVQSSLIPPLAAFCKQSGINFISALSPSDANIDNNPFFTLLQPRLEKHCEKIQKVLLRKHSSWNTLVLFRDNNPLDSVAYTFFNSGAGQSLRKLKINELPSRNSIERFLDSTRPNIIAAPIMESNYADSVLQTLYDWFPGYQFEVYGMPTWKFISNLKKPEAYPNAGVYFTTPFYYEMGSPVAQTLMSAHRKRFGTRISEVVFRGYEIMFWYAYLLNHYGTVFNPKISDNSAAPFTRFEIKPQWSAEGGLLYNENEQIYLFRYQAGSFAIEP